MNAVFSEIKQWNTKFLRKLGNNTNALVVNLLHSSETTRRFKRYTVLTLPDRPEENPNTRIKMIPKRTKKYISYATGHNSFTSKYLLNMYIYCRFCSMHEKKIS
jgi:hypothetical protein